MRCTIKREGVGLNSLYILSFDSMTKFADDAVNKFFLSKSKTERRKILNGIYKEAKHWREGLEDHE